MKVIGKGEGGAALIHLEKNRTQPNLFELNTSLLAMHLPYGDSFLVTGMQERVNKFNIMIRR